MIYEERIRLYEELKREIYASDMTAEEIDNAIRELAERLKI